MERGHAQRKLKGKHVEKTFNYLQGAGREMGARAFLCSTRMCCSVRFARNRALSDVNESPLLRVLEALPLFLVIPDGRSNSIFSQHCKTRESSQQPIKVEEIFRKHALEQWSLTGGKHSSFAISVFFIFPASSNDRPLTRSVMYELEAMALPQPKVLNLTSEMTPSSSTLICNFITSPHLIGRGRRR